MLHRVQSGTEPKTWRDGKERGPGLEVDEGQKMCFAGNGGGGAFGFGITLTSRMASLRLR